MVVLVGRLLNADPMDANADHVHNADHFSKSCYFKSRAGNAGSYATASLNAQRLYNCGVRVPRTYNCGVYARAAC
eukprot:5950094-Lingulodinium_polyedra.AAC.1